MMVGRTAQLRSRRRRRPRRLGVALLVLSGVVPLAAAVSTLTWSHRTDAAESGAAQVGTPDADLPPLPAAPKLEPALAERAELEDLDARLRRLVSDKPDERRDALREVLEVRPRFVAAVLKRLDQLAERADRERMKRALNQAREKSNRAAETTESPASDSRQDLLMQLVERARPKDDGWRELVELVAISRMLTQIGNVHAARGLIEIYVRFGEFMRVDVQNRLLDLKDGAVAALIEARRHRAEKVGRWAERQLDRMGKVAPNEAIRTENFEVLADVLRAYGRTKDPDAARIIVTYASSERYQLREAAREAIVLLGQVGIWQLREAYETVAGKRPRRDWSWERTARELFFEYDKLHEAKTFELLAVGNKAAAEGRLEEMAQAYDALLARSPQFDKAATIAPGYFRYAEKVASSNPRAAEAALVRVERLAADPTLRQKARSLRDSLRAERLLGEGVIDAYLIKSAIERDPTNQRAKELLTVGDRAKVEALTARTRWLTSGAIGLTALIAILLISLRRSNAAATAGSREKTPSQEEVAAATGDRIVSDAAMTGPTPNARGRDATFEDASSRTPRDPNLPLAGEAASDDAPTTSADASANDAPLAAALRPTVEREVTGATDSTADSSAAGDDSTPEPIKKPRDPFEDIF